MQILAVIELIRMKTLVRLLWFKRPNAVCNSVQIGEAKKPRKTPLFQLPAYTTYFSIKANRKTAVFLGFLASHFLEQKR